jgi:hypothetical protein
MGGHQPVYLALHGAVQSIALGRLEGTAPRRDPYYQNKEKNPFSH